MSNSGEFSYMPKVKAVAAEVCGSDLSAEDLRQESRIAAHEVKCGIHPSNVRNVEAYIAGVFHNMKINAIRERQRQNKRSEASLEELMSENPEALGLAEEDVGFKTVVEVHESDEWKAFTETAQKDPVGAMINILNAVRGYTDEEISHMLGKPINTIRSRKYRFCTRCRGICQERNVFGDKCK